MQLTFLAIKYNIFVILFFRLAWLIAILICIGIGLMTSESFFTAYFRRDTSTRFKNIKAKSLQVLSKKYWNAKLWVLLLNFEEELSFCNYVKSTPKYQHVYLQQTVCNEYVYTSGLSLSTPYHKMSVQSKWLISGVAASLNSEILVNLFIYIPSGVAAKPILIIDSSCLCKKEEYISTIMMKLCVSWEINTGTVS